MIHVCCGLVHDGYSEMKTVLSDDERVAFIFRDAKSACDLVIGFRNGVHFKIVPVTRGRSGARKLVKSCLTSSMT